MREKTAIVYLFWLQEIMEMSKYLFMGNQPKLAST